MLMQEAPGTGNTGNCCPRCNSARDVIPVVYTEPTPQLRAAQRKGKVIISDSPCDRQTWYCKNCGAIW